MSKKVRLESVLNAASRHLGKRNCTDTDILRRSKLKLKQTAEQFENSNLLIQKRIISIANCSLTEHEADVQYSRLKAWVESLEEEFRVEMEDILFPAFISLYRKLKSSGNNSGASSFYTRHQSNFLKVLELRKMAERFCSENNNHHFSLELTQEAFEVLSNYVASSDHMVLQYLLNTTLEISILCIKGDIKSSNSTTEISSMKSTNTDPSSMLNGVDEAQDLMAAIARMNELPSTLPCPALKMHTIDTGQRKMCSASVSSCHSYLSAGFQDSTIAIWDMKKLKPCARPQNSSLDLACAIGSFHPSSSSATLPPSSAADPSVTICHGHSGPVYSTLFTQTNTHLLTSSDDTTLRLWDLSSMENTVVYRGHTYPVWATDISGQYFVSGSKDRTCKLWSFERTYPLRVLAGHTSDVDCVAFHPNGLYVATGSADSSVRMWSVTEGNMPRTFVGHRGTVLAVAFSPCGYLIASAGEDHRIKIWDIGTNSILFDLAGHNDVVHGLVWISKHILGSYSADGSLRVWDVHHQQPASVSSGSSSHAKQFASYSVPSQWKPVYLGRGHRGSLVCVASSD